MGADALLAHPRYTLHAHWGERWPQAPGFPSGWVPGAEVPGARGRGEWGVACSRPRARDSLKEWTRGAIPQRG